MSSRVAPQEAYPVPAFIRWDFFIGFIGKGDSLCRLRSPSSARGTWARTWRGRSALELGNRTIVMDAGKIVLDISGAERAGMTVSDLLDRFHARSGREMDNDRMLLG